MAVYSDKSQRYKQVLDDSFCLFFRTGFQATTIRQIALEAAIADGTVCLYFKSEEDIRDSLLEFLDRDLTAGLRQELTQASGSSQKVEIAVHYHLARGAQGSSKIQFLLRDFQCPKLADRGHLHEGFSNYLRCFENLLHDCQKEKLVVTI